MQARSTVAALRASYERRATRDLAWREAQLDGLLRMYADHGDAIANAAHLDSGKPVFDAWVAEVAGVRRRLKTYKKKLRKWVKDERVSSEAPAQPARSKIVREPLGVVLVIAPWNFPSS